jgi:hypothetical protein|tara:strand:- start:2080 stop:2859 length:780 start_codon:yes stop_codon:yes gene_type:complete
MKKTIYLIIFVLIPTSLFAQEDFYTKTLKELIAIQTLIAENRVSDLSDFLDEYSYVAANEKRFVKYDPDNAILNNLFVFFEIKDDKNIVCIITKKEFEGRARLKIPKSELHSLWSSLLSNVEIGMPYSMFKFIKDSYINKNGEGLEDSEYKLIDSYKLKTRFNENDDWKTHSASNFNTAKTNDKFWVYTFMGPGKLDSIDIYFPKSQEQGESDVVDTLFYFNVPEISILTPFLLENKEPINIPFFMGLKNFNDRIWNDN